MNKTKHAILITFYSIQSKGNNHYCKPAPNRTIKLLKEFHKTDIKRSWFFQCCKDLEMDGYIKREVRRLYPPGPEIRQIPSMWTFTIKGALYLKANRVVGADQLVKNMIAWINKNDGRWPTIKDILPQEPMTSREETVNQLFEVINNKGTLERLKINIINGVRNGTEQKTQIETTRGPP